ncbi:hypothetical protein SBV1_2120012 [Verrucomicrobia bacterium]|nr:hypothetical protein SBV1_2120012 [Verrucomicrobiota bacterium]
MTRPYWAIASNAFGVATSSLAVLHVGFPDVAPYGLSAPATATIGQSLALVFSITNNASGEAYGPWLNQFLLALDTNGTSAYSLGTATFNGSIPGLSSLTITQSVIVPATIFGTRYFELIVDSATNLVEITRTNNTVFATNPIVITGADLAVEQISAPGSAQYGQSFSVSFAVTNVGGATAFAGWNDQVLLSASSNSLSGATLLATLPGISPLAPGAGYTSTQVVTIPQAPGSTAGTFYLVADTDAGDTQLETNEANNLLSAPIVLSLPPLPDLVAGDLSSPTNASSGQTILVSWTVTNLGAATATAPWQESVYLVPADLTLQQFTTNVSGYPAIGIFSFTNNLLAGSSASRTQQVTMPAVGLAGDLRVAVWADSANNVLEQNEINNTALALNDLQVPWSLSLNVPVTNVLENTSAPNLSCLVSRNGDLTSPVVVSLASSATNKLVVPGAVTIPAGGASAPFTATVVDDGVPEPNMLVSLTASGGGYQSATSQIWVVNTEVPALTLSFSAPQVVEGQTFTATVRSSTSSSQPVVATIVSSNATALATPAWVTIPANSNSATFTLLAAQSTVLAPAQTYILSVSANGYTSASASVTVLNNNAPSLSLELSRTNINENDGPFASVGTISRAPVTDQAITVALGSTNPGAALVPAQITIPSLQSNASFFVSAVYDANVTGPKLTSISAQALDNAGNLVGSAVAITLMVEDVNSALLHVSISSRVVPKGANPATSANVWTTTPPTNDLVVTLSSSDTNEATVPISVTMPAGQTNVSFAIATVDDQMPGTSQSVTISASAPGYGVGSDVLAVTDLGLPDLVIASISAPPVTFTAEPFSVSIRLLNQGLGALTNGVTQNVYLTTNLSSSSYALAASTYFAGPLAPGQYVDQTVVVPGSSVSLPGSYWVVVLADANNNAVELNKANNEAVSAAQVVVSAEYSATVTAGVTTVLAGTPVPLFGSATLAIGGPATNQPVDLLITVRGLQRIISVVTDTNGNFSTVFTPFPTEAGVYTVSAVLPGITSAAPQAQFNILGMTASPASPSLTVVEGSNVVAAATIQNLSDVPLSGLTAIINGLAPNLMGSVAFSTNYLAGQAHLTLSWNITAIDASIPQSSFTTHLTSSEGAVLDVPVGLTVIPLFPHVVATPAQLSSSMLVGTQTVVQFMLVNQGGAATGPLTINLPSVPWLSMAYTNPLPSMAPGTTNYVALILSPPANQALGPYSGTLAVDANFLSLSVPFTFTAVSDAHGALSVHSVDEYTYFASGSPPLTNATVRVLDPFTQTVVASGVTDTNGAFFAPGLMAGAYELDLSAPQHAPFRGEAIVSPGGTNSITAFLSLQTVTFTWTVVPTTIQETTHITIDATFEANVPAPVIVPNPLSIDLGPLIQPGQYLDIPLTLVNYGLIAVQNVNLNFSQHPLYQIDVLTTDVGNIPAHGTVTIPMRITRLVEPGGQARSSSTSFPNLGGIPCSISFAVNYSYPCGSFGVQKSVPITFFNVFGNCPPSVPSCGVGVGCVNCGATGSGGYGIVSGPGGGPSGIGVVSIPFGLSFRPNCDPCWDAAIDCLIGLVGLWPPAAAASCGWSIYMSCGSSLYSYYATGQGGGTAAVNCSSAVWGCVGKKTGAIGSCLISVGQCICPGGNCWTNIVPHRPLDAHSESASPSAGTGFNNNDLRDVYWARTYVQVAFLEFILGDPDGRWMSPGSGATLGPWIGAFNDATLSDSPSGIFISPEEATNLLALPVPNTVSNTDVVAAINRWNLSISNWQAGIFSPTNVPTGGETNFMDIYTFTNYVIEIGEQIQISQAAGYDSPLDGLVAALQASGAQGGSVCAQVVLQIDQDAVLTRDAFHATLQMNNSSADPLTSLSVNLVVQNQYGQDVTSLFGIETPVVSGGLTAADGTGVLAPGSSGSAQWTLIPSIDAAPQVPTNYLVSGTFSYVQNGASINIPLAPAPITVQPSPQLYLKYFLQRDVFGDDPYTPEIEPSIPFPLAVMVANEGYGVAQNFQITSAQPTIVDNEKGLLIHFSIIGTEVAGQQETPSLTANFGDLEPQSNKVGEWLFISSLQGLFVNYQATFQDLDPLGNPRLSLIQGVEIHQMIHMVQAPGLWDDGQPDFLTDEMPNYLSLPDTLYLSDGTVQPVSVVQTATTDGPATASHLQVQFTANFPAGFTYVVVPDPADGQFPLVGVRDNNGTNLLTPNFYTTDRTFIGLGQRPLDQNNLHLFDHHTNAGTYTYTLIYQPASAVPQTNPPVSSVFALPAQSPPSFGVAWSGAPYVGQAPVAYYDIYVSGDGGPFTIWQSETRANAAFFNGTNGHTYAFYSIATDTAGNREAVPLQPEAQTTVNFTNYPPTISVPSNVTVNAGQTLSLVITASDANPFANLTFSLGAGAPLGMSLNPITGQLVWPTSPALGASTNYVHVIVADNSQPPLTATAVVAVAVVQVANPPTLAPIPNFIINELSLLIFTNSATDNNLPPRPLVFSLGAGAPINATIDPTTGVFQWTPNDAQANSTNVISVVVTDNSSPPLSDTQRFTVIVRAVAFEYVLSVGSTNVLVGLTASVPVTLDTLLPLTNIAVVLHAPTGLLTNLGLAAVSPEIISTALQPLGTNQYGVSLTLNPALSHGTSRTLAQLGFVAVQQTHSAIAPLGLSQLSAVETGGQIAAKPGAFGGQVFIIGQEPVLYSWLDTNSSPRLTLFGNPGVSYQIAQNTNLLLTNWQSGWSVTMTNTYQIFDLDHSLPQEYYRAWEFR